MAVVCMGSVALQIGCYTYLPVQSQPPQTADRVSVSINDRGRVLLAERIGPLLDRVEGKVIRADSAVVVLAVSRVVPLKGDATNWIGEEVSIPRDAILGFQARPLSKPRTFALVGAVLGGLLALALSVSLAVSGTGPVDPAPGGGVGQG